MFARVGGPATVAGSPFICVHGAVISGRYMLPVARALATRRRVHVPDCPGYGRSEDPPDPMDVPALAHALLRFVDAADIPTAHVLGNSLGAQVAACFAATYPERTASAILVGPTVDPRSRTRHGVLWRLAKDAFRERPSLIPLHLVDIARAGPRFAIASLDIALADRIEEHVARATRPMLVVSGTRDPLVPRRWAEHLASLAPGARVAFIPGPHALNYSRPAQLARVVEEFVSSEASD